jgi:hypothetical protein
LTFTSAKAQPDSSESAAAAKRHWKKTAVSFMATAGDHRGGRAAMPPKWYELLEPIVFWKRAHA